MIIKTVIMFVYFSVFCSAVFITNDALSPMYWSDISIISQIHITVGIVFMAIIATVAMVFFKSVWIKKGYEGLDRRLEGKEVALMLSHIIALCLVEGFFFLLIFGPYTPEKYPQYVYWICAGGFIEPGVFLLISNLTKKKEKDTHEQGRTE